MKRFTLILFFAVSIQAADKPCCTPALAPGKVSDRSLYQVETLWRDDHGKTAKLLDFRGRPQVVTMFFSTCVSACPLLVNDMKRLEAALPETVRTNVTFVLVSFDSERDTPEVLARFRARHRLPANWKLLRGESDDVLELASLLGIKFRKEPQGGFAHSNLVTLLNGAGEIVAQESGLNRDPGTLSEKIKREIPTTCSVAD